MTVVFPDPMKRRLFLLIVFVVLLLTASSVFARAGGGGSYGGGGGGGGGGAGGGSGMGYLFVMLIRLAIERPLIGVPLLIVVIILLIKFGKKTRSGYETRTITRAGRLNTEQDQIKMEEALQSLIQRDPAFTPAAFLQRAGIAFTELQTAWSDQDLGGVRQFISDGINERFSLQVEMQRQEGFRNRMENIAILSSRIVGVTSDRHFDTIHVEITAKADDADVDLDSGRVLRRNSSDSFIEYWSFMRKPGAQTLDGGGLVEGSCPNCGAHLELSDSGKCSHCDSVLNSGEYDWVLAEITQSMEWNVISDTSLIPGLDELSQQDQGFNLQHIEDRTSVIFWRLMNCWFLNETDPARKVVLPTFLKQFATQLDHTSEDGWWLFFRDAAVGAVEVQSIIPGQAGDFDRIEVLVKWSGRNARRNAEGKTRSPGGRAIRPQIFTLARKHGAQTSVDSSFRSSHCPNCGAPYEGGTTGTCDYCGTPLNDGARSWVLESVKSFSASRITQAAVSPIRRASLVPPDIILSAMVSSMYADGEVDEKEMEVLRGFAEARSISDETLDGIIDTVKSGAHVLPEPSNPTEVREVLAAMARMAIADGKLSKDEKEIMQAYGEANGLAWADVKLILAQQKAILYAQAKTTIRESK